MAHIPWSRAANHRHQHLLSLQFTRRQALDALGLAGLAAWSGSPAVRAAQAATTARSVDHRLEIIATDYRFTLPAGIPSGYAAIALRNAGSAPHHAMFMRLKPGNTAAEFVTAARHADPGALLALADSAGGPGTVDPGQASDAILRLDPGEYVVICIIPDARGMPHYQMGMLAPLTVTADGQQTGAAPAAEATVDLVDFSFKHLPHTLRPGRHVWKIINTGAELHEMALNCLAPGYSYQQVKALLIAPQRAGAPDAPPPVRAPFVAVGGIAPMSPGGSAWTALTLPPADYFAICFVPDPKTGEPHFDLGMIKPFTVAA